MCGFELATPMGTFAMRPAAIAFIVAWLMIAGETAVCFW
jgi:hypothetical protein